jgi:MarR family transcriptional regulator, organic hydroperoxide resistance regulator
MIKILEHLMNDEGPPGAERLIEDVMGLWRLVRAAAYPPHQAGLTAEQFWLLRYLERQCMGAAHPISVGALAEALGITPSSATSACKRLEQAGLVTRTRQATDERVVQVDLTAQGRAQLGEMRRRQREAVGRLLAVLDPQEQATLQRLLARVLAAGRQSAGGPSCGTSALRQKEPSALS